MPTHEQLLNVIRIQTSVSKLGLDLDRVMQLIAREVLELVAADGAAIELAEGDEMVYQAVSGIARGQLGLRLKLAQSMSGLCVRSGEPLICTDSETDARVDRNACRRIGLRSMIIMPLADARMYAAKQARRLQAAAAVG